MNGFHIVAVNDDPTQLRQLTAVLEKAGHEVSAFLDAADALGALSDLQDIHLFIVDLHMPGIDGWKLCRLLRSPEFPRYNDTPILVVSATFTGSDVTSITRDLGANAFLEAPFEAASLRRHVTSLLVGEAPRTEQVALIVEDDEAVRATLRRAFTAYGYQVVEAGTAVSARARLAEGHVDVVLLDYHLPDNTCEALLSEHRGPTERTSILVMTGDTDPELPVRLLARGADAYLRKPFDPSFAVELAQKAARQRALLRIESLLEARTRELQSSEKRYRELFRTIPDLVVVLDARRRVAQINPEGLALLEASEPEVLDRPVVHLVAPGSARVLGEWLAALERSGSSVGIETELVNGAGDPVAVELNGRCIEWQGAPAILLAGRDLTERRRAEAERRRLEAQMQHAQRLESLGVLAGGVAHDFNNLLVGILGNASLAAMDLEDGSPLREPIQQIELAARRAAELSQQILVFAGKSKVSSESVDLAGLIHEMGKLLDPAVSKKARVSYHLPERLPTIRGDAGQLRQVVMNLIINASDALGPRSGEIRVTASLVEIAPDTHFAAVDGGCPEPGAWVAFEVADTGCGMDKETIARIFEPFFTTKFSGRGLGLASTLGIVRAHCGFIQIDSAPGAGTTVTVLLPPHRTERERPTERPKAAMTWPGSGTVLVVDDEPQVRNLARSVLTRKGFDVIEAADGVEGVDQAMATCPDAIVMDLSMPEMDGVEALRHVRAAYPSLPVVLSSGYPPDEIVDREGGASTAFLKKPYGPDELLEALHSVMFGGAALTGT